jgi:hypothetical protein
MREAVVVFDRGVQLPALPFPDFELPSQVPRHLGGLTQRLRPVKRPLRPNHELLKRVIDKRHTTLRSPNGYECAAAMNDSAEKAC